MRSKKKILRRFLSIILAMVMVFTVPSSSFAYIGAIVDDYSTTTKTGTFNQDGLKYVYLQNDYIHFDICVDKKNTDYVGQYSRTLPVSTMNKDMSKLSKECYQMIRPQVAAAVKKDGQVTNGPFANLKVTDVSYKFNGIDRILLSSNIEDNYYSEYPYDLALYYTTNADGVEVRAYFRLVKLNAGSTTDNYMGSIEANPYDTTNNWGVICNMVAINNRQYYPDEPEKNMSNLVYFRLDQTFYQFPIMGHEDLKSSIKDINVSAQTLSGAHNLSTTTISNGVKNTTPGSVIEIFSDSYNYISPFVAGSFNYYPSYGIGVEGHDSYYADSFTYAGTNLEAMGEGCETYCSDIPGDEYMDAYTMIVAASSSSLWGYRYITTEEEIEEQSIEPDKINIRGDAPYLCVFPDGDKKDSQGNQIYKVLPASDQNEIKTLENNNGPSVAQYRGSYVIEEEGGKQNYKFIEGAVALSPSITATWDTIDGSYVKLKNDGKLEFSNTISLNTPTFKFYEPISGGGIKFEGYDATEGIKLSIDPKKNKAVVNINLPGNSVQLKGANIDTKGNLLFTGKFKLNLFVAQLDMQKLGYGLNNKSEFVCNGVHAKGTLKVPKIGGGGGDDDEEEEAKPNVLGFGGAKMEGEVDTFKGYYDFKFELTIKNLFSTKAELTLVKLKNGRLCPEHLYFELKVEAEGAGIDLAPAAPAVTITGGGGGIDGLASTIDGNYTAIPPVVLTLATFGQVVKVVDGKLIAKIGPSQLRLIGEDVGLKVGDSKLKVIDKMSAGVYLTGKDVTYEAKNVPKKTYRGITFGGDIGIGIKIFNFKDGDPDPLADGLKFFNNTISAEAALGLETYVGEALDNSKWWYVYVGTYGKASCSLNIPAGIKGLGGKSLLGAGLDFKLGAQTAFQSGQGGNSFKSFFKNMNITGGIAASGHIWPVYGRVIYIIPKTVKFQGRLFKDVDELDWDEVLEEKNGLMNTDVRTVLLGSPDVVETENGEEALVMTEANIMPVMVYKKEPKLLEAGSYSQTVKVKTAGVADDENIILAVVPKNAGDIDAIKNSVSCSGISTLNWMPDVVDNEQSDPGYNAWVSTFETDADGNPTKEAVFLSIPKSDVVSLSNSLTVSASAEFDIHGLATTPVTELEGYLAGDYINTTIANPETSKEYVQYTYFGTKTVDENGEEQITTDYIVDQREIDDPTQAQQINLNSSGNIAPTGDYYVTSSIVYKGKITVENEQGQEEEIDTEIPVSSWVSGATYSYTNTETPTTPADAALHCIGNEAMRGSFKKSANADGYKVTIYQEDENGQWVDTGRGYSFDKDDFASVPGLSYDSETGTYSIDLAMTVGGDGEETTLSGSEEGSEDVTISEEEAKQSAALEAGKTYRLGVQAYKSKTIVTDGEESSYDEYSDESLSQAKYLPKYRQVSYKMYFNGEQLSPSQDGTYDTYMRQEGYLYVDEFRYDGDDVSDKTTVTVTKVGELDDEGNEIRTEIPVEQDGTFYVGGYDGKVCLEVSAAYEHEGVKDETLSYVYIEKDEIAPVITLDEDMVVMGDDGSYAFSGVTEPKSVVYDLDTGIEVVSDSDGVFSFTGVNSEKKTKPVVLRARDKAGNESESVSVILTVPVSEDDIQQGPEPDVPTPSPTPTTAPTPTPTPTGGTATATPTAATATATPTASTATATPEVTADPNTTAAPDTTEAPDTTATPGPEATNTPDPSAIVNPSDGGNSQNPAPGVQIPTAVNVSGIKIDGISKKLGPGVKVKLSAEVSPDNASDKTLTWSSSNTKVATVDASGIVKINKKAKGKSVTITAAANDGSGVKAEYKIKVVKGIVKSIAIKSSASVKAGKSIKLKATVKASAGANKKLMWISSDPALATVNSSGNVKTKKTAKKKTVKITVMATDGSGKKKTVKVKIT